MPVLLNLRHLERKNVRLEGEIPASELDMENMDELIHAQNPLVYAVEAQKMEHAVLVQGRLRMVIRCECARCLKSFDLPMEIDDWSCLLALEGEEQAPVVNDCVDLTPYMREDILLEFPQHPLCDSECGGLPAKASSDKKKTGGQAEKDSSAWAELNKLKF